MTRSEAEAFGPSGDLGPEAVGNPALIAPVLHKELLLWLTSNGLNLAAKNMLWNYVQEQGNVSIY